MLEQEIRADIDERQRLMLQVKTLCLRYRFLKADEEMFLNYSIPTIYAIWEGFVQTAFRIYIQELNSLNLTVDMICKPILTHHLENKFKQFREYPKSPNKKLLFFNGLDQFYTERVINISPDVNTESNVGFDVINKLLKNFNIEKLPQYPEPMYSLSEELKRLVDMRNKLAHGNNSVTVNRDDLNRAVRVVKTLMDLVFEKIMDGFRTQSYLHTP